MNRLGSTMVPRGGDVTRPHGTWWRAPRLYGVADEGCRTGSATLRLNDAVLCLDCEAVFPVGPEACPRCASHQWVPLARLLNREEAATVTWSEAGREPTLLGTTGRAC
jgi:RNA polymerase subunit RPABC4/transcription elongation factor Spt4